MPKWWNNTDSYIHSDLWETINTKRNQNWLHDRKGRAVYTSSPAVLQMSKIRTPQRDMQRMLSMWQMWRMLPRPYGKWMQKHKMCKHPAFSRTCGIYKKGKEIIFIKHTKNMPFPEARKIVESYMGTKTYANAAQKVNQPPHDSTSIDKYQKNW